MGNLNQLFPSAFTFPAKPDLERDMTLCFMDGNEAIARAAFGAGCRFFAGYPITPAGGISDWMRLLLPPAGGVYLQGEDEIAAIGNCLGAAMTGNKVMTATSGPGLSLFSEQISFAIGSEIPIVIVNVQRLGPSTGSPTRGADGDIQFMRWGCSGGLPVTVLSPVDVRDCYELTYHAFNLSESYRCPVFIASNKEIGMTHESLDLKALRLPKLKKRRWSLDRKGYRPFWTSEAQLVPDFLPIGGNTLVRQTSSTHGTDGFITVDPRLISAIRKRLVEKIAAAEKSAQFFEYFPAPSADILVITYGVSARAAKVAVSTLANEDRPVSLLILKTLFPVLGDLIRRAANEVRRVIVVEMNLGQYIREIERLLPDKAISFLGQMDGELITPDQIKEMVSDK